MSGGFIIDSIGQTKELTKTQEEVRAPKKYKVLLLNDDYTPMDFVVEVLTRFFHMGTDKATKLMLEVHFKGKSVCGIYTKDVAETKVAMVNDFARNQEYPLLCAMEPE